MSVTECRGQMTPGNGRRENLCDNSMRMIDSLDFERPWDEMYARLGRKVPWAHDPFDDGIVKLVASEAERLSTSFGPILCAEIGCGNGRNLAALRQRGINAIGVDFSQSALTQARESLSDCGLVRATATDLPFAERRFAIVYDYGCLHAIAPRDHRLYAANVARVLDRRGTFIVFVRERVADHPAEEPVLLLPEGIAEWGFTVDQMSGLFAEFDVADVIPFAGLPPETFFYFVLRPRSGAEHHRETV